MLLEKVERWEKTIYNYAFFGDDNPVLGVLSFAMATLGSRLDINGGYVTENRKPAVPGKFAGR
jgi:hypothetical protein